MTISQTKKPRPEWLNAPTTQEQAPSLRNQTPEESSPVPTQKAAQGSFHHAVGNGSLEDIFSLLGQAWTALSAHPQVRQSPTLAYRKPPKVVTPSKHHVLPKEASPTQKPLDSHELLHAANTQKAKRTKLGTQTLPVAIQNKLIRIVGAIESRNNYSAINTNPAGGGIAYGNLQVLSRNGGLDHLLQLYTKAGGIYAKKLLAFGSSTSKDVAENAEFQKLLKAAGKDPLMKQAQTTFFREQYLQPALRFGQSLGLRLPSSFLILFDAFIHYGANKPWLRRKLSTFTRRFGEVKGMEAWMKWMRRSLKHSYGRRFGANSIEARYNVWRADALGKLQRLNPHLHGSIRLKAPQWTRPVVINDTP
ncbi:MAG: hypothetical protein EP343_11875 [Deltaproteobacteria bacterium]|nr:MAG: hypothetical protein EP343_11875 [Deltaproteobacteria bacterium]